MNPDAPVTKTRIAEPPFARPRRVMSATDITILPMSVAVITRIGLVARWKPDAVGRLQQAALELFVERGYDNTTVADIAERAELTERTFFRYFADKREV